MVFEKIQKIISEQTDISIDRIQMETKFREDLNADSLDLFQIISNIEEEFDVQIDDPEKIVTVGDAVTFVEINSDK